MYLKRKEWKVLVEAIEKKALFSIYIIPDENANACLALTLQVLGDKRNNSIILLVASGDEPYLSSISEDIQDELKANRISLLCLVFK